MGNYFTMDTKHQREKNNNKGDVGMPKSSIAHYCSCDTEEQLLFKKDTTWLIKKRTLNNT